MSQKFHINKHGVPAPCRATKGNCPYGGDSGDENHFSTHKEAAAFARKQNEEKYGLFPGISEIKTLELNEEVPEGGSESVKVEKEERPKYFAFDNGSIVHKERDYYRLLNAGRKVVKEIDSDEDFRGRFELADSLTENYYREVNGLSSPPEGFSVKEEREFYLSQDEIEPGMKYGPHSAKLKDYDAKKYVHDYLGPDLANQAEDAVKLMNRSTAVSALILPKKERAKGIKGMLGFREHQKGILIKKIGSDYHEDSEHGRVFQMYYLDEQSIKKIREDIESKQNGIGVFEA